MDKDSSEKSYCRLCAELKSCDKLTSFEIGDQRNQDIMKKLIRINALSDFNIINLPRTVCFVCINSLDRAYEFVTAVGRAQTTLSKDLIPVSNIKEEQDTEYDFLSNDQLDSTSETTSNPKLKKTRSQLANHVKKREDTMISLDVIPLSQLKLTWRDYNWVCAFCETQFPTIDELQAHSMQYHGCCNAYRCSDCNIRKLCLNRFLVHVRSHKHYLKLSCYKCFTKFRTPHDMRLHLNKYITSKFTCAGCNRNFDNPEELEKHKSKFQRRKRETSLAKLSNNLTCLVCKKTFKNKHTLNSHLLSHKEKKYDHICEICGKCFQYLQNLESHRITHDDTKPHKCEICQKRFRTIPQLRNHVGTHDGHKPFACEQCGRHFRLQRQLHSHSIIHTDSLPYICPYCKKGFRFKTILNQHIRQHTGDKPYSCENCKRDFTNWPNYNKHMKRKHGKDMAKKKHTPDGLYPIDAKTGEVMYPEKGNIEEWKKKILKLKRPGRPRIQNDKTNVTKSQ